MSIAVIVGILTAAGTYLILQRGLVRVTIGFMLLSHAVNVLLLSAGGTSRRAVAFSDATGPTADPLPQAFALTAIVISFGTTAFLLALAVRGRLLLGEDDTEDER